MSIAILHANKLLDELRISRDDLVKHLNEIAWQRGALVIEGSLSGSEARLNMAGKPAIITISNNIVDVNRKRFGVAHELGHLEMHRHTVTVCSSDDTKEWQVPPNTRSLEQEANEFAAALLMPERYFGTLCDEEPSFSYLSEIASEFSTSLTATAIRYCWFTPEPVAIVYSENGSIRWFKASQEFLDLGIFVSVKSKLHSSCQAAKLFQGISSTKPRRVSADVWLRHGDYRADASVREESILLSGYNAVLSILWVDEDIYDEDDELW